MKILAIETSCDDTSIAIFENEKLLSMDTKSQIKIHQITWWVVPEIAAREHANSIFDVLEKVLKDSETKIEEIEYIWVTAFPWLLPSLLTWLTLARTMWKVLWKKVIEINHIQWHIFSNFIDRDLKEIEFPLVCLTVSGWHNDIYFMENMWSMEKIWTSSDDAAWESYDKVSKMMWLSYPGWPIISEYASKYRPPLNPLLIKEGKESKANWGGLFPRVWLQKDEYDFSFSWLKSAVKREIDKRIIENWKLITENFWNSEKLEELRKLESDWKILLTEDDKKEISYEFQDAVNEVLAFKLVNAWIKKWVKTVMLAGWVSANDDLKEKIEKMSLEKWLKFIFPVKKLYSMDNAAMIWILTYYKILSWNI